MTTVLYTHPCFLDHDTGEWHPECADRIRAALSILDRQEFADLIRERAPEARVEDLLRAHDQRHIDGILGITVADGEHHHLDADTLLSKGSAKAARHAAGAVVAAVDEVLDGKARNAFCLVRPPGHHAERQQAMGFCLFNNVAVGALYARDVRDVKRVAIVDFDVHHGNGTQHILWDEPGMLYASSHQDGAFPYTGLATETGGKAMIVNAPLPAGSNSEAFRTAYEQTILPALDNFSPQLLMISAGFDGHAADPMAHFRLKTEDFGWITTRLMSIAATHAKNRVVSVLEGGYEFSALAASIREHVRVLMGY